MFVQIKVDFETHFRLLIFVMNEQRAIFEM